MASEKIISTIQQTEQEAEQAVVKARDIAQKKKSDVDERNREQFANVKELLSAEMSEIAEKIQAESKEFKTNEVERVRARLSTINNTAKQRVSTAVEYVVEAFKKHVGQ